MKSYEDVEDFVIEKRGQAIQHPQVRECNQKSWHLPEDCTLTEERDDE